MSTEACPLCHSTASPHCDNRQCDWGRCKPCALIFNRHGRFYTQTVEGKKP